MAVAHGAPVALAEPAVPVKRSWVGLLFAANLGLWMVFFTPVQVLLPQQISDLGVDGKPGKKARPRFIFIMRSTKSRR